MSAVIELDTTQGTDRLGDVPRFVLGVVKLPRGDVARFVLLGGGRGHALGQAVADPADELTCQGDHCVAGTVVLLQRHLAHIFVTAGKGNDVADVGATPLVDGLVVVPNHAEFAPSVVDQPDQAFLHRIHVLILVHQQVPDPFAESRAYARVGLQRFHRQQQLFVKVQVGAAQQPAAVVLHSPVGRRCLQRRTVDNIALTDAGQRLDIVPERITGIRRVAVQVPKPGETGAFGIMRDEQGPPDLIQRLKLQELRSLGGQQAEAEAVDGADEHIGHSDYWLSRPLGHPFHDASPQFGSGLVGEGEGDDVSRSQRIVLPGQQMGDPPGQHLGFARAGAGQDLQVPGTVRYRFALEFGQLHRSGIPLQSNHLTGNLGRIDDQPDSSQSRFANRLGWETLFQAQARCGFGGSQGNPPGESTAGGRQFVRHAARSGETILCALPAPE